MGIDHIAVWAEDIEKLRSFYMKYFGASCGRRYHNRSKGFTSFFLSFGEGARLELMHRSGLEKGKMDGYGWAHVSISVGGKDVVDALTEELRTAGFAVLGEPRTTGDGYYESVVADPEGNIVEITV